MIGKSRETDTPFLAIPLFESLYPTRECNRKSCLVKVGLKMLMGVELYGFVKFGLQG